MKSQMDSRNQNNVTRTVSTHERLNPSARVTANLGHIAPNLVLDKDTYKQPCEFTDKRLLSDRSSAALLGARRTGQYLAFFDANATRPHPDVINMRSPEKHQESIDVGAFQEQTDKTNFRYPVSVTDEASGNRVLNAPGLSENTGQSLCGKPKHNTSLSQPPTMRSKTAKVAPPACIRSQIQINFLSNIAKKSMVELHGQHTSDLASSFISSSSKPLSRSRSSDLESSRQYMGKAALHTGRTDPATAPQKRNVLDVHNLVRKQGQRIRMRFVSATNLDDDPHLPCSSNTSVVANAGRFPMLIHRVPLTSGALVDPTNILPNEDEQNKKTNPSHAASIPCTPPVRLNLSDSSDTPDNSSSLASSLKDKPKCTSLTKVAPTLGGLKNYSNTTPERKITALKACSSPSSSTFSSASSESATLSRPHRFRRRRCGMAQYWHTNHLASTAAAPISVCTILTCFAPQDILQWREQQVMMPFKGETFSDSSHSLPRRSSLTRRHHANSSTTRAGSDRGSSRSSSFSRHFKSRQKRSGGTGNFYGKQLDEGIGAHTKLCDSVPHEGYFSENETYQDFVVNSQFLRGNYEDGRDATSSSQSAGSTSSSTSSSSRSIGRSEAMHYSRSTSTSSSSSTHSHGSKANSSHARAYSEDKSYNRHMRSYRKMLKRHVYRDNPAFYNAFFLDSGNITGGERRKKLIVLPSYRTSVISFVDKKILKKDLNSNFYVQHPELEVCGVKLTHLRKIKNELLVYALAEDSPLELATVAHSYWYFERLVVQGMVSKSNRKVILAACVLLAIKFLETGDVSKKLQYFRNRWKRFHLVPSGMLGGGVNDEVEEDEDNVKVEWAQVERNEFPVYVGLDFTLLQDLGSNVIHTHIERLLQQINVTFQEYYSRKFLSPVYFNKYNYYSNLYY